MTRCTQALLLFVTMFIQELSAQTPVNPGGGPLAGPINAIEIDPLTHNTVYAGTDYGLFKSFSGGQSWSNPGLTHQSVGVLAIDPVNPVNLYAVDCVECGGAIFKSIDGGASWTAVNIELGSVFSDARGANVFFCALAIDPSNPAIVYAGACGGITGGGVFKSTDGGGSWTAVKSGFVGAVAIDPTHPATLYAGTSGGVFKSTNAGASWTNLLISNTFFSDLAIDPSNPAVVYAGGSSGFFKSVDGGASWNAVNRGLPTSNTFFPVLAIDPSNPAVVYAGTNVGVFKSADGGANWANSGIAGTSVSTIAIDPINPAVLYAGTNLGVFKSADGGASWNAVNSVQVSSATHFVPMTPCRIADTRIANGPFGGPAIAGGTSRDFAILSSACGIPSTAAGYSMNVAVVPSVSLGLLTLWPTGQPQPLVATLNSIDGRIKSNAAVVPAGSNGAVSVFVTDTTDVILDINGYFVPGSDPAALAFYPLTPCRIADTRNPTDPLGGPRLAAQGTRSFPILASSCGVPASAQAYSLNFAAVPPGPTLGYLTAWPAGQPQPLVASLNDPTGTVLANAVVVRAGTGGAVDVYTTDATDLVIDINGYFAPPGPGGLSLYTVPPCRVLDSRLPAGSPPFDTTRDVNVTGSLCGVPATAQAFVFNATVVPPGPLGFITMWPQGQTQPLAATLNATDGAVTNNMAIVPTTTGSVSVFSLAPTHLVLDIFGYFAP